MHKLSKNFFPPVYLLSLQLDPISRERRWKLEGSRPPNVRFETQVSILLQRVKLLVCLFDPRNRNPRVRRTSLTLLLTSTGELTFDWSTLKELVPSLASDQSEAATLDSTLSDGNGTCAGRRRRSRRGGRVERWITLCSIIKKNTFPLEFRENLRLDTHCVSQTSLVAARLRGQWLNPGLSF